MQLLIRGCPDVEELRKTQGKVAFTLSPSGGRAWVARFAAGADENGEVTWEEIIPEPGSGLVAVTLTGFTFADAVLGVLAVLGTALQKLPRVGADAVLHVLVPPASDPPLFRPLGLVLHDPRQDR
jgi:hypothetical protein